MVATGSDDRPGRAEGRGTGPTDSPVASVRPVVGGAPVGRPSTDETRRAVFIDGAWLAIEDQRIEVVDPTLETPVGTVPDADAGIADRAVEAAARAFPDWSATPVDARADLVAALAAGLAARTDDLVGLIAREVGTPLPVGRSTQVGLPVQVATGTAEAARTFAWEESIDQALVVHEPAGVVVAITPWNYPLHQLIAKVSPALAAGCTVIAKPSGLAPLSAFVVADVAQEIGLPPGVLNVVTGRGSVLGEALAGHPRVDLVSLTGSAPAGRRMLELAAPTAKRVTLQLGGKSATVVLDDADLEQVIPDAVRQPFRNTGQNCSALSRLIVPRSSLPAVERLAAEVAAAIVVGDPFDPATEMGPLVSSDQRDRVRAMIEAGEREGARRLIGGPGTPPGLERGYFLAPTVFSDVQPGMRLAQDEIFGPVLSILAYDGDDDAAIALANDSAFGLSGAVWSADPARAERAARRMRTGRVAVNGGPLNPRAPFGGYKASGIGREFGRFGLEEYLEVKTLQR